jgi:hypothetical protein
MERVLRSSVTRACRFGFRGGPFSKRGFGFLTDEDGREIYFDRNSVVLDLVGRLNRSAHGRLKLGWPEICFAFSRDVETCWRRF